MKSCQIPLRLAAAVLGVLVASQAAAAPPPAPQGRSAKVLLDFTLPPLSLTAFGYTEDQLAEALANGLTVPDAPALGSGLQRLAGHHFLGVTDRGPNFNITVTKPDGTTETRRIFPLPEFTPTIVLFKAGHDALVVEGVLPILANEAGLPVTGLTGSAADDPRPYRNPDTPLDYNPNGWDVEDVALLPNGTFLVVEELSPSVLVVSPEGVVLQRYIPSSKSLPGTAYPVSATLPGVLKNRRSNRGFETIAVSPDGRTGWTLTQSPLGSTSKTNAAGAYLYRNSRVLRLLRLDLSDPLNLQVTGQFAMLMSSSNDYPHDAAGNLNRQQDLKMSAGAWVAENKLLLLERTDEVGKGGMKLVLVDVSGATDLTSLADPFEAGKLLSDTLSLEDVTRGPAAVGVTPAETQVVYDAHTETPELTDFKLEGLAILNPHVVAISNDNDFGIGDVPGARSALWIIRLKQPLHLGH